MTGSGNTIDSRTIGWCWVAQRVAGAGELEAHGGAELAGEHRLAVLAVVGVHLQEAADALLAVLGRVVDVGAGVELARVDAKVGELADVGVGHDLEGQGRERLVVVGLADDVGAARRQAVDRRHVERRGQVVDDRVEQRLDALVLEARAAEHRRDRDVEGGLADGGAQLVGVDLATLEVGDHDRVAVVGDGVDQAVAIVVGELDQVVGDGDRLPRRAELVGPDHGLHGHEVDDAPELGLAADRHLQRHGPGAEALDHHVDAAEEVGADAVHLVDVADARDAVLVGLAPDGLGLRLDAAHRAEQGDGAVEHAQAALDLDGEVHVPGRVYDVDAHVAPVAGRRRRGDGDAALLFLLHPVHHRRALVHLAHLMGLAGVVEDAFGGRRLAGIDVGHDADVARLVDRELPLCSGGRRHVLAHSLRLGVSRAVAAARARRRRMRRSGAQGVYHL